MFKPHLVEKLVARRLLLNFVSPYTSSHVQSTSSDQHYEDSKFIQKFLEKNPKATQENVIGFYKSFEKSELPLELVPNILKKCPELVKIPPENVQSSLKSWLDINIGEGLIDLISTNPSVLFLTKKHIENRFSILAEIFGLKPVGKIMVDCPLVLTEPAEKIKLKVDYLEKELKYTKAEIIKTGALNCGYERIRTRFEFLKRAGGFKIPKPKTLIVDKSANPQLSNILFLNNHDFANQIVGVSLLEFIVFQQLLTIEEDSDYEDLDSEVIKTC